MKKSFIILSLGLLLVSCNHKPEISNDHLLFATLYQYYSAEYKALSYQAYNMASERIKELKNNFPERTDMAIVLDIDETILDNSPYQAKMIKDHIRYDSCWIAWCNAAQARVVPGADNFLNLADSLGFNIFYISNRKEKYVKESTILNMQKAVLPQCTEKHFLLRTNKSDKSSRRNIVSENYEIVLLVGDNLGDFYSDKENATERLEQIKSFQKEFGKKFIVLPNAMYGNWVKALELSNDNMKADSLLSLMLKDFSCK